MATPMENPQLRYLKTKIESASQPQLLVMLFDAAVKKLHMSKKAILDKDIETSHTELTKVQKIFTELMVSLDMEKGGNISADLMRVYDYIYHRLVQANIKQDTEIIDEVLPLVDNLRDGWTQAVEKVIAEDPSMGQPKQLAHTGTDRMSFTQSAPSEAANPQTPVPSMNKPSVVPPTQSPAPKPPAVQPERPRLNLQG